MNWLQKLMASLKALGLPEDKLADATKAIEEGVKESQTTQTQTPAPGQMSPEVKAMFDQMKAQNDALMKAFADEKKAREDSTKALQDQAKLQRESDTKKILDEAIAKGKFTPADRDKWSKRLEGNFDLMKETIAELPENKALAKSSSKESNAENKTTETTQTQTYQQGRAALFEAAKAEMQANQN